MKIKSCDSFIPQMTHVSGSLVSRLQGGRGYAPAINAQNESMVLKQNTLWFFKQILIGITYAFFFQK